MNAAFAPAVFIGDVALDEYFSASEWVRPGNKALIETLASYVGGSIANAARVHAKLGGDTEFISLLNRGALTARILETLAEEHVGAEHMLYDDEVGDQRNFIFLVEGEHVVLTPDVDERPMRLSAASFDALASPGYLYTTLDRAARLRSGELGAAQVLQVLRDAGRRVVFDLDVDGLREGDTELLRGAHLVMMNDRGFEHSFGAHGTDAEVRAWLRSEGIDVLLRSQAAAGATSYTLDKTITTPGYEVPVVDVTGAGDTLGGALVWALGSGMALEQAVQFAVAAASRSVMHMGPTGGVAEESAVRSFAAERGMALA